MGQLKPVQHCKMNKVVRVILGLVVAANCMLEDGRFHFRGKPYVIVSNEKASWYDAESFCISRGLLMCSIEDEPEFDYVAGQLISRGLLNENVWIGGTEIGQEDNYYWTSSGEPVELGDKWDPTEVANKNNRCMVFYKGKWRHNLCTALAYYVCESPEVATTPAPTTVVTRKAKKL